MRNLPDIIILGGARDYHAIDWYRSVRRNAGNRNVFFLTDMIQAEGFVNITLADDNIYRLFVIDRLLFSSQSYIGHIWRNIVKFLVLPIQIWYLKRFMAGHPGAIVHAHPMYYMLLCRLAGVEYIGTPQGSEILVRPQRSLLYKTFAIWLLRSAKCITVDSLQMAKRIQEMAGVKALLVQNGISISAISEVDISGPRSEELISIRGMSELYRIEEIIEARARTYSKPTITFIYPFSDEEYVRRISAQIREGDRLLGRLDRSSMYELLAMTKLVVSIPKSDSSPRSVYEAIFLGCCVAATYNPWMENLPDCMRERVIIVDLSDSAWLEKAIERARQVSERPFEPSLEAIEQFDEVKSMNRLMDNIYAFK